MGCQSLSLIHIYFWVLTRALARPRNWAEVGYVLQLWYGQEDQTLTSPCTLSPANRGLQACQEHLSLRQK